MSVRHGFYASWRGTEYEANPDGDLVRLYSAQHTDGFTRISPDRYVQVVSLSDVEHLRYVTTHCTWHGVPFVILGEHDGWLRVEYSGGEAPVAERLGLELFDRGVYQAWASRHEVEDVREEAV
ncbi:hypothetical protein E1287_11410 [Actinomadura sp. KC06]|uniref:hypothetical protein n=1 Tax=Actinomadura sp. KC06 TaxID=2530369 RepID=UPI0010470FB9|nr:hypothetical protein [Actinomadura sp. KC06]TDD36304.1 hypothetical protein E1287_11410 [Actinomadura sp. KC06]